jgi:hypothetical protein
MFGQFMLPNLTAVKINFLEAQLPNEAAAAPTLATADIKRLVECCPFLTELDLAGAVVESANMSSLQHLNNLSSLVVGGACFGDRCAEGLAQLPGLKQLSLMGLPWRERHWYDDDSDGDGAAVVEDGGGPKFTFRGLQQLMQLTQLTTFTMATGWFGNIHEDLQKFKAPVSRVTHAATAFLR